MSLGDRVKQKRTQLGISQEELGKLSRTSQPTIQNIESGRNRGSKYIVQIAAALGVTPEWLAEGTETMRPIDLSALHQPGLEPERPYPPGNIIDLGNHFPREPSEEDYALIPQYSVKGSCGYGALNSHVEVKGGLAFLRTWLVKLSVKPENASVIYANGDSMSPTIEDGDVVLMDLSRREPRNGKIYAFMVGDEIRIKRFFKSSTGESWKLASDNPDKAKNPDERVTEVDAIAIIGQCVWQGGRL